MCLAPGARPGVGELSCPCGRDCAGSDKTAFGMFPVHWCAHCKERSVPCGCPLCWTVKTPQGKMHRYCGPHKLLVHYFENRQAARTAGWLMERLVAAAAAAAVQSRHQPGVHDELSALLAEAECFVGRMKSGPRPALHTLLVAARARLAELGVAPTAGAAGKKVIAGGMQGGLEEDAVAPVVLAEKVVAPPGSGEG